MIAQKGEYFTQKLIEMGRLVRGALVKARRQWAVGSGGLEMAGVAKWTSADAIYEIDTAVEPAIVGYCEAWAREMPLVLIAEGIGPAGEEGKLVLPRGTAEAAAHVRIIMDPIDGTRGLMYDKRSGWFLAGVAPNKGDATKLSDVFAAVQVELPVMKQGASDVLWAVRGQGAKGMREEMRGGLRGMTNDECRMTNGGGEGGAGGFVKMHDLAIVPSGAENIEHGFATVCNFFPGTKEIAARLMEEIAAACVGVTDGRRAIVFDDQYITTGGQFYELMVGHDRFIADLRPLFYRLKGMPVGMSVHPYDMAAMLIATEAGVELTDGLGGEVDGPLDVDTAMQWAGFANKKLRERIEPVMTEVLVKWLNG